MPEHVIWIVFAHALLFCLACGYARFLNQDWVYRAYSPDHVWVTVVGGVIMIWPFVVALYWLGLPWWADSVFYITLHLAAGAPIIYWQRQRKAKRIREVEAL